MDGRVWRLRAGLRRALLLGPPLVLVGFEARTLKRTFRA
jgi:hypothetical protein